MELIMLGTGNAMVTRCYNTCFVLSSGEEYFLVDAGGGNGIFKQKTAYEITTRLVGSEMCIRDSYRGDRFVCVGCIYRTDFVV